MSKRHVEVRQVRRQTVLQAALGMEDGRLGALEHGVEAGDLQLATYKIRGKAHLAPLKPGSVSFVNHLQILLRRPLSSLHKRPHVVEQLRGQPSMLFRGEGALELLHRRQPMTPAKWWVARPSRSTKAS